MRFLKLAAQAAALVAVVGFIGCGVAWAVHPKPVAAVISILAGGCVCLVMGIVSLLPVLLNSGQDREWLAQLAFLSMGIRLLGTLAGAGIVGFFFIKSDMKLFFGLCTVGFYILLLFWETMTAIRIVKLAYSDPQPVTHDAE